MSSSAAKGVPLKRDHDVVARHQLRSVGRRDDPRAAAKPLERHLAGVLVLVERVARCGVLGLEPLPSPRSHLTAACRPPLSTLDLSFPWSNAREMTGNPAREHSQLLTFGGVRLLRVQVGYRLSPDDSAYQQYLLDLPVHEENEHAFEEARVLAILEPVLYAGSAAPRHFSLHQHRWHTSWGMSPSELEIGLLIITGTTTSDVLNSAHDAVIRAFRGLMELTGRPALEPLSRDDALLRARHSAATAFKVEPESLWLGTEEHHPGEGSWTVGLRTNSGEQYEVRVGLVDGYAGSARVGHARPIEVSDSLGSE